MLTALLAAAMILPMAPIDDVSEDRIQQTITKLSSWPNRNTSNPTLTEAASWIADQLRVLPGLQVEVWRYPIVKGPRVPEDKEVVEVIATLPGKSDRRVMVGAHLDSINMTNPDDLVNGVAPGANDDGSGIAVMLECARAMAGKSWNNTVTFIAFSGEEQGLLGSTALAARAKREEWKIDGLLSNDMVGNSGNDLGQKDDRHVRVFSEESSEHNSRELARLIEWLGRDGKTGVTPKLVFRADRFGRGGDHSPFNREGITAIRMVEMHEEYSRQHTTHDTADHVDFHYVAANARLNLITLESLANAAEAPTAVRVDRRQSHDAHISWHTTPGTRYVVYWRDTTSPVWQASRSVGSDSSIVLPKVSKDDNVFAVGAEGGIPIEAK